MSALRPCQTALPRTSNTKRSLGRVHKSNRVDTSLGRLKPRGYERVQKKLVGQVRDIIPLSCYERLFH
jgi:hypothetical protein